MTLNSLLDSALSDLLEAQKYHHLLSFDEAMDLSSAIERIQEILNSLGEKGERELTKLYSPEERQELLKRFGEIA